MQRRLFFLLFFLAFSFAIQAQSLEEKLTNRWGLRHFVEAYGGVRDTLFSTIDCQKEYLQLKKDKSYHLQAQEKTYTGKWNVSPDSIIQLLKPNGKVRMKLQILEFEEGAHLAVLEMYSKNAFVSIYEPCDATDGTVEDTRGLYEEYAFSGLAVGLSAFQQSQVLELGYTFGTMNWRQTLIGWSFNAEVAPWNDLMGASAMFWTQGTFMSGVSLNAHVATALPPELEDEEKQSTFNLGARVYLGFSPRFRSLGRFGKYSHISYSYNLLFLDEAKDPIPTLNRHAITFRTILPVFKNQKTEIRKLDY
jgi:hypothetical protein